MTDPSKGVDHTPNIWSYTYRIRSHEVEPGDQLSLPTLFHLMQDGASSHAKALGLSVKRLMLDGYTWVLSRLILNILSPLPKWEEQISIQTWPSGNQGPFALRDFLFKNSAGQTVATALSGWLIISTDTRKPQRIGPFVEILRPIAGKHVVSQKLTKILPLERIDYERRFNVRRRDLDINQHVNNVCYMDWLIEALPDSMVRQMALKSIALNFLGEAKQDDQVISAAQLNAAEAKRDKIAASEERLLHRIFRSGDEQELFRAQSIWVKRSCL